MEVGLPPIIGRPWGSKPFSDQVSSCWLTGEKQARSDRFRDHVIKARIRPCRGANHADYRVTGKLRQTATARTGTSGWVRGLAESGIAVCGIAPLIGEPREGTTRMLASLRSQAGGRTRRGG